MEHLTEVLAETVGGSTLDTTSGCGDEAFDGCSVKTACKFLLFGFDTGDDGDGEELLVDAAVKIEDLVNFLVGAFFCKMGSVAFLPKEFTCAEEWFWRCKG